MPLEENKTQYKCLGNQMRKVVAKALRKEDEQKLKDLCQNFISAFYFLQRINKEGKNLEGA